MRTETASHPTIGDFYRFLAKISIAATGCWEWAGVRMPRGYGQFGGKHKGKNRMLYAHRISHSWFVGPIPEGYEVDHLCMNTCCVNPAHLEAVLPRENARRYGLSIVECKHGHPFDEKNTYRNPATGRRECRACNARRGRELRERRRLAA